MKNEIRFLFLIFILLFSVNCKVNQNYTLESTQAELKEFIEKKDDQLTVEQVKRKNILFNSVKDKIVVKDNQFYNLSKPNDFEKLQLSKFYYNILEQTVSDANRFIKDENIMNVDSLYKQSLFDFFQDKNH